jgi:hypothetical protein
VRLGHLGGRTGGHALGAAEPAAEATSPWAWKTKLGIFFKNVTSHNAENSRDPSIAGSTDTVSWTASGAGQLIYQEDDSSLVVAMVA